MSLFLRRSVTPFVILFEGRTGSSYLVTSLSEHPNVRAGWEELVRLKALGHEAQAEWTRKALTAPLIGRFGAVGFKTKLRDIADPTQFSQLMRDRNVKIIHMQRRNRVKVAISERTALSHGELMRENQRRAALDVERFDGCDDSR